jgi:transcriptional/translational regulatory protein YebC/TACO1
VAEGFRARGIEPESVEFASVPQNTVALSGEDAGKVLRLLEALEDLDDVQNVYSNADLENAAVGA